MSPFKNSRVELELLPRLQAFIESLELEEKEKSFAAIGRLRELPHPPQLVEMVDKNNRIYELRAGSTNFWIRMFWFYYKSPNDSNSSIILTNGYLKKENKTDPNEIKIAVKIKSAYEESKTKQNKNMKEKTKPKKGKRR